MLKRLSNVSGSAFKCALLALCIAVISWGLSSKLSLYRASTSQSAATTAKLSTETKSSQTMAAIRRGLEEPVVWATASLLCFAISFPTITGSSFLSVDQIQAKLCGPCRCNWQGPDIMHRPPPTLA